MHVLILTEGSLSWGLGHLYRCLGFARYFANKGSAVTWLVCGDQRAADFLEKHTVGSGVLLDWTKPENLAYYLDGCLCAIVDSYHAPLECYKQIALHVPHCVWVDDSARIAYPRGTVVNPNPLITQQHDSQAGGSELLSGFE